MLRYATYLIFVIFTLAFVSRVWGGDMFFLWPLAVTAPFVILGTRDLMQTRHSVLRNYPIIGHLRFFFEEIRPELRQYFFESDTDEAPYNREQRALVYQRAKDVEDKQPFGTKRKIYGADYFWLNHSIAPSEVSEAECHVTVGGPQCSKPYSASLLNISAMSFGSLSGNAVEAMNRGAKMGDFAQDTGEGGISRYHRVGGGDLIWEIGTGYFGCRRRDGSFCPDTFVGRATRDQVKMIEIKLSQGAKPGHGGILPGVKVTEEIVEARDVPLGEDVISPANHSAFSTPLEMMEFIAKLRDLSGGKPVGFKLCIGHRWEFLGLCKAMIETGISPDFIVVDGKEGGTGAAPVEFTNHIGTPLVEGLTFAHNALVGAGLRDAIKIGASGKMVSAMHMIKNLSLGADWCNAARAFMFSVGCLQSLACHTNKCPTGVATQDKRRQRALVVEDKAVRVFNYHHNTIHALKEVLAAAGLRSPGELRHNHFFVRDGDGVAHPAEARGTWLEPGELLSGSHDEQFAHLWDMADSQSFRPKGN